MGSNADLASDRKGERVEPTSSVRIRWPSLRPYVNRIGAAWRSAAGRRWPRLVAVLGIVGLDAFIWRAPIPEMTLGVADEICHLTTAALMVSLAPEFVRDPRHRIRFLAALAASVLIDLDHIPKILFGATFLSAGTHRPYGHTALAVIGMCALAIVLRTCAGASNIAWGTALGIVLHLVRDLATGGAALVWPATFATIWYPYPLYVLILLVAAVWPTNGTRPVS
jgi:inner membrane protein